MFLKRLTQPSKVEDGNGLNNMKKRAHEIDGSVNIQSEIAKGTTVQLQMPIKYGKWRIENIIFNSHFYNKKPT
jgi:sensor histidine kinase YesM